MKKLLLSIASLAASSLLANAAMAAPLNLTISNATAGTSYMYVSPVPLFNHICTPQFLGDKGYTGPETGGKASTLSITSQQIGMICPKNCTIKLYWDKNNQGKNEQCTDDKLDAVATVDWSKTPQVSVTDSKHVKYDVAYNGNTVTINIKPNQS